MRASSSGVSSAKAKSIGFALLAIMILVAYIVLNVRLRLRVETDDRKDWLGGEEHGEEGERGV